MLNELAGPGLAGLDRFAGRKKAVAELCCGIRRPGGEEAYANNVGYSERADVPIEPRLTWQWWMRYPRVEEAKAVVEEGLIKFYPERWKKVYLHWLNNIQDWCISRQLWWGHRIPVWYRKGSIKDLLTEADLTDPVKVHVSLSGPPDPENWLQEEDVLDTWASSWLWPIGTLGWPDADEQTRRGFDYFYPTETLVTDPGIIFFWVARMIMAGLEFSRPGAPVERRIPFRHVYLHGAVQDGPGPEDVEVARQLSRSSRAHSEIRRRRDALRHHFHRTSGAGCTLPGGADREWKEFLQQALERVPVPADERAGRATIPRCAQSWTVLNRRNSTPTTKRFSRKCPSSTRRWGIPSRNFEFAEATQRLYVFFWNDFCDWYVEVSKSKLQSPETRVNCLAVQDLVLRQTLLLLHPFIPFVTEELWQLLGYASDGKFIEECRLDFDEELKAKLGRPFDAAAVQAVQMLQQFVSQARALKAEHNLASRRDVRFFIIAANDAWAPIESNLARLIRIGRRG